MWRPTLDIRFERWVFEKIAGENCCLLLQRHEQGMLNFAFHSDGVCMGKKGWAPAFFEELFFFPSLEAFKARLDGAVSSLV